MVKYSYNENYHPFWAQLCLWTLRKILHTFDYTFFLQLLVKFQVLIFHGKVLTIVAKGHDRLYVKSVVQVLFIWAECQNTSASSFFLGHNKLFPNKKPGKTWQK